MTPEFEFSPSYFYSIQQGDSETAYVMTNSSVPIVFSSENTNIVKINSSTGMMTTSYFDGYSWNNNNPRNNCRRCYNQ